MPDEKGAGVGEGQEEWNRVWEGCNRGGQIGPRSRWDWCRWLAPYAIPLPRPNPLTQINADLHQQYQ